MNQALLEQLVNAVLYEGYILYPYRASSKKNCRARFTLGRVYPEAYSRAQNGAEPCFMQTECLLQTLAPEATVEVCVRFLQPVAREMRALCDPATNGLEPWIGRGLETWHEAIEREVKTGPIVPHAAQGPTKLRFDFPGSRTLDPIRDEHNELAGLTIRRQKTVEGRIEVLAAPVAGDVFKLTVRVFNQSPLAQSEQTNPEAVLLRTLASTHTILQAEKGAFVSLMSPPPEQALAAAGCQNIGTWPVMVGEEEKDERDTMLSSPIILYDYPKVAPESAGPLFDSTEIDELLTLRVLTLTDEEKMEMRRVDAQARHLLERTEALPQKSFLTMHGAMRARRKRPARNGSKDAASASSASEARLSGPISRREQTAGFSLAQGGMDWEESSGAARPLSGVCVDGTFLQAGDRVRIRPKGRGDVLDLATAGRTAVIEAVEQDLEQRVHLAVVLDCDPGRDLGFLRQPGHRFFYGVDEVEPLGKDTT